jgi:hypothetical protein
MSEYLINCLECGNEFITENKRSLYCSTYCKSKHSKLNKGSMVIIVCGYCGKNFESSNRSNRFCSSECKQRYYIENPIQHEYNLICNHCGKNFIKMLSNKPKENENHYCSQECVGKNKAKIGIDSFYNCKYCGIKFKQMHKRNFYCSSKCKTLYGIENPILSIINCSYCGKEIQRLKSDIEKQSNFFCSRNCESNFTSDKAKDIRICRYCGEEFQCKKGIHMFFVLNLVK